MVTQTGSFWKLEDDWLLGRNCPFQSVPDELNCLRCGTDGEGAGQTNTWCRDQVERPPELTFLPESLCSHSPLSYHHLFFNLSKMACSLSFSTARFTGILQRTMTAKEGEGVGNNINNIMNLHVILCYCSAAQQHGCTGYGRHLTISSTDASVHYRENLHNRKKMINNNNFKKSTNIH